MRSRRGQGRPNLRGSLREENHQTKTHKADLHTGTELRTKNSFASCHVHSDMILVHVLIWKDPYKDKLAAECNEIHIPHVIKAPKDIQLVQNHTLSTQGTTLY